MAYEDVGDREDHPLTRRVSRNQYQKHEIKSAHKRSVRVLQQYTALGLRVGGHGN